MKPILSRNRENQNAQPTYNAHVYNLINVYELRRFCLDHPLMDSKELLCFITRCFADQVEAACLVSDLPHTEEPHPLEQYATLRPTHDQIRNALLRLLEMPCPEDSTKKLIYKKSHWLAVMRAMQFLEVVSSNYGARQEFVDYLHGLFPDNNLGIMAANLKAIESESPFNRILPDWYGRLASQRARYYWRISITFLECFSL